MGEFTMPSLGAGMEEGILAKWHCQAGDRVERGEIIAEVETEKGLIEVEVWETGVVAKLLVAEGTKVPVGTPLAIIEPEGATAAASAPEAEPEAGTGQGAGPGPGPGPDAGAGPRATPGARQAAREAGIDVSEVAPTGRHGTTTRADVVEAASRRRAPASDSARVSPYARRRAEALGIDPAGVAPGPDGAVHAAQVEAAARARPPAREKVSPAVAMRRAIAAAMTKSKREIPHYYLTHTIDLGPATAHLGARNEGRPPAERIVPGVLLLAATARALKKVPELNARWGEGEAPPLEAVHLGVAIALRGGGLVAPAIHDAQGLALEELMERLGDLVSRARRGQLRASELSDPTITVTSLGDRGVETVIGVIHPPQVAMVGFGRILERPWVVGGEVVARPTVTASLAADHRVSDGHRGGLFLAEIERLLMHPEEL